MDEWISIFYHVNSKIVFPSSILPPRWFNDKVPMLLHSEPVEKESGVSVAFMGQVMTNPSSHVHWSKFTHKPHLTIQRMRIIPYCVSETKKSNFHEQVFTVKWQPDMVGWGTSWHCLLLPFQVPLSVLIYFTFLPAS